MARPCEPIASAAAVRSDSEVAKSVAESLRLRPVGTINVLVVEDDEMQRLVLDKLFTAANGKNDGIVTFDVTFAATAAEAVATLEAPKCVQFSIILLDMMLPDLNGYDLLPKIRALVGESVAILVASLHTQIELVQLCVSRGADAFLVKPLGSDEAGSLRRLRVSLTATAPRAPHRTTAAVLPSGAAHLAVCQGAPERLPLVRV